MKSRRHRAIAKAEGRMTKWVKPSTTTAIRDFSYHPDRKAVRDAKR